MRRRIQDHRQRRRIIQFLGGECCRCGLRDHRGLVIVRSTGYLALHQLYTLVINEPELAVAELRLVCATCRQIERYQDPSVAPSMSSADIQPAVSEDHPFSSSFGFGAARDWWGLDVAGVSFG